MWTKESVIVLGVTEAIHLNVNRVVSVPVICIMVVEARIGSWVRPYIYLRVPTSCASVVGAFLLNLRAAQVVEVFLVAWILLGHLHLRWQLDRWLICIVVFMLRLTSLWLQRLQRMNWMARQFRISISSRPNLITVELLRWQIPFTLDSIKIAGTLPHLIIIEKLSLSVVSEILQKVLPSVLVQNKLLLATHQ